MKCWFILAVFINVLTILNAGPEHEILFTNKKQIALYDVSGKNFTTISDDIPDIAAVDFDYETQMVFYVKNRNKLYSLSLITKETKVILTLSEKADIKEITVDWITKKIYFTEIETKRIEVCKFDGSDRRTLFNKDVLSNPHGVAVSPLDGLLFYTDWGDVAKLMRVNMDGSNSSTLAVEGVIMPTVVTVDRVNKSVIWYDFALASIEAIQMDGSGRRKIFPEVRNVFDMTILGTRLYISELKSDMLSSCNLHNTSSGHCRSEKNGLGYASITAFGKQYQPFGSNSGCHIKNGGCTNLCLLKPNGYSCACPTGIKLLKDKHTCAKSMEKFIILASRKDLRIISLDVDVAYEQILPYKRKYAINTIDYDPVDKKLYWTDHSVGDSSIDTGYIFRAALNGSVVETVVPRGYTLPDSPAIDWVARNLYWTCPEFNKIYVSRLDGSASAVIVDTNLEEPRGITVDPTNGYLYWSDWGENPKIEVADLDGENRTVLVSKGLKWPNGIALDYIHQHLYWVDAGLRHIEFYDLLHKTRHVLEPESSHPYSISISGNFAFWTDWSKRHLYQFNLITREQKKIAVVPDIMGVKAVDTSFKYGSNKCQYNNNGCSHFCFNKPKHAKPNIVCGCPDGYQLDSTKKGCTAVTGYLLYSTQNYVNLLSLDPGQDSTVPKILDSDITHLSTHSGSRHVFWVQNIEGTHSARAIKSVLLNDTGSISIIQTGFYAAIGGIVVDWIGANIYWTEESLNRVEVSKLDGKYRRTLFHTNQRLSLISINPIRRKLYWFEEYERYSNLFQSNLDGTARTILTNITGHPNGLAVDVNSSRIFWVSKNSHSIESIYHDGSDRKVITTSYASPIGLTVFRDRLYFCEQESMEDSLKSSIISVDKKTGIHKVTVKVESEGVWFQSIAAFHDSLQIGENICERRNGGCQHLCFATSLMNRTCECEMHYTLNSVDNTSCIAPDQFILLSEKSVIYRILLERHLPEVPLHIPAYINATQIDYNIHTETIYWLNSTKTPHRIHYLNHTVIKTVDLGVKDANPCSFVIDFFTNSLYWIDKTTFSIGYVSLDDSNKSGIIFMNKDYHPSKLAILPEKGLLFFVNEHLSNVKSGFDSIESITLDGVLQKQLQRFNEHSPKPDHERYDRFDIAVDYQAERLFWLKNKEKKIWSVSIKGGVVNEEMAFHKLAYHPVSIAVHGTYLYWVDVEQSSSIEKLKKVQLHQEGGVPSRKKISHFNRRYKNANDLIMVDLKRKERTHPCKFNNGGCSHICFIFWLKDDISEARCACPRGYLFKENSHVHCKRKEITNCKDVCDSTCRPSTVLCEDLAKCKGDVQHSECLCKPGEFRCPSMTCIKFDAMCDGKYDCVNGEDENEKECEQINNKTMATPPPHTTPTLSEHPESNYSTYTAGIISGAIITSLIFVCVLYIVCIHHHKKVRLLNKQEHTLLGKPKFKFEAGLDTVSIIAPTESLLESSTVSKNTEYRYITGSSTDATDTLMIPSNPPPSIMTSTFTLDMDSVSRIGDDYNSNYCEDVDIPAPPSTPIYVPSDAESIATFQVCDSDVSFLQKQQRQQQRPCIYCRKQTCAYNDTSLRDNRRLCCQVTAPSLASSYISTRRKQGYNRNSANSSIDSQNGPSLTRQLSYLTSIADSVYSRDRRLLPSLASENSLSRYSSQTSMVTIRELKDGEYGDYGSSTDSYGLYAPPPSPGCEFTSDMNDFTEFKDEVEEAFEIDFLLDSHRPPQSPRGESELF